MTGDQFWARVRVQKYGDIFLVFFKTAILLKEKNRRGKNKFFCVARFSTGPYILAPVIDFPSTGGAYKDAYTTFVA